MNTRKDYSKTSDIPEATSEVQVIVCRGRTSTKTQKASQSFYVLAAPFTSMIDTSGDLGKATLALFNDARQQLVRSLFSDLPNGSTLSADKFDLIATISYVLATGSSTGKLSSEVVASWFNQCETLAKVLAEATASMEAAKAEKLVAHMLARLQSLAGATNMEKPEAEKMLAILAKAGISADDDSWVAQRIIKRLDGIINPKAKANDTSVADLFSSIDI